MQMDNRNPVLAAVKHADYGPDVVISPRTGRPKRRKATRACVHCQRTHLTCDNNRPCERCVGRGLADTCQDGTRKKAKYLQDVPEAVATSTESKKYDPRYAKKTKLRAVKPTSPSSSPAGSVASSATSVSSSMPPSLFSQPTGQLPPDHIFAIPNNPTFHHADTGADRHRRSFESSAVKTEYSVLSNILHGKPHPQPATSGGINMQDLQTMSSPAFSDDSSRTDVSIGSAAIYHPNYLNQFSLGNSPRHNLTDILANVDLNHNTPTQEWLNDAPKPRPISLAIADNGFVDPDLQLFGGPEAPDTSSLAATGFSSSSVSSWPKPRRPADIYRNVRTPFPYTPGFHQLVQYLKSRFEKQHLMQMARCMARYRPSFIACTNSLDQDDLVFMEQCFQRTLLEYEKYISFSGTPTVIWRRTGQIAAVGKEFCLLTGWRREQLLDRDGQGTGMFIVEVMQDESVLEYFQMFSDISFGDSQGAMMTECSLLTPNGQTIKTSSVWTLKRDVFGIPMMIIGNFLPILP
jgi:hypothetical protein